jgi:hypothetical protein
MRQRVDWGKKFQQYFSMHLISLADITFSQGHKVEHLLVT